MGKLFGTDGIRGKANQYPLTPAVISRIGQAVTRVLGDGRKGACIVVGTDTRVSADMIESSINAGICSLGVDVLRAGVIPTPGVAYLTVKTESAAGGIVISASHNPYVDNGIKVFGGDGYKLSDATETAIEQLVLDSALGVEDTRPRPIGRIKPISHMDARIIEFHKKWWPDRHDVSSLKVVIDCANGATYRIAPVLFNDLGMHVTSLFVEPNGQNINENCGSEHTATLSQNVVSIGADLGVAFDGDGDRLAVVDETGRSLTGDQILAILANDYLAQGILESNIVVSTVMSNIGLGIALKKLGIVHYTADVGDRKVMEMMRETGAVLGGEDSGHIILRDRHTTGDGLLSAIRLLEVMVRKNRPLSELAKIMTVAPQTLVNVAVSTKPELATVKPVQQVINEVETELKDTGRVLVRYSGTQMLCRVMVEGATKDITRRYCNKIAEVISESIG